MDDETAIYSGEWGEILTQQICKQIQKNLLSISVSIVI